MANMFRGIGVYSERLARIRHLHFITYCLFDPVIMKMVR